MRKSLLSQIDSDEQELLKLNSKKQSFILASKEAFVAKKMSSLFYSDIIFYDKDFKNPINESDLIKCFNKYYEKLSLLNDRNILLKAAFCNDFFDLFLIYEDPCKIFDKTGLELTLFQKNLLIYGHVLITKLRNGYQMPDEIKNNPIKIFEWSDSSNKKSKTSNAEDFNVRQVVEKAGGLENIKPEHKIT